MNVTLEDGKRISDVVVSWMGIIGALVGGYIGFQEYKYKQHQDRVAQTLSYVKEYNSGEVLEARRKVSVAWSRFDLSQKDFANEDYRISVEYKISTTNRLQLWLLADFHGIVWKCVTEGLCDKKTALAFFGEEARRLYNLHFHYIEIVRKDDETFAMDWSYLVTAYVAESKAKLKLPNE